MAANPPPQLTIDSSALDRPPKRRRTTVPPPPVYDDAAAVLPEHLVADLLNRSTATIMKAVGFDGATLHAQERMRQLAEDYLLQMLHTIQLFSRAGRRTRPTVFDFQDMLAAQHLPLSTLEHELHRFPPATSTSLHPRAPSPPPPPQPDLTALLGPALAAAPRDDHLPPYPSRHTYLSTPVYTSRPVSPRQIRERATEEARLAENALRKLLAVGAGVGGGVVDEGVVVGGRRWERDEAWRRAWEGVKVGGKAGGGEGGGAGVEGGVVNAERRFWRKGKRGRRG